MNDKEILRLNAIRDACDKRIRRADAAHILSLSVWQAQRLMTRFRKFGVVGITHQRRGLPSPIKISEDIWLRWIDGSHHDWFEGRSSKCCLLVYIYDATGRLMNLRFTETESAFDYMVATRTR